MSGGHEPTRMCMICRRRFAQSQLLRHVLSTEDGHVEGSGLEADEARTRPGRGWYICTDPDCRKKFLKLGRVRRKRKGV